MAISEAGTAIAGISAARRLRKNSKTTSTTRTDGNQQGKLGLVQRGPDAGRAVLRDCQGHVGRQHGFEGGELLAYGIHRLDDIGVGLAPDNQQHGALLVEETGIEKVFDRVLDRGDILHAYRRAIPPGHDKGAILRRLVQLRAGIDLPMVKIVFHHAVGAHGIGAG